MIKPYANCINILPITIGLYIYIYTWSNFGQVELGWLNPKLGKINFLSNTFKKKRPIQGSINLFIQQNLDEKQNILSTVTREFCLTYFEFKGKQLFVDLTIRLLFWWIKHLFSAEIRQLADFSIGFEIDRAFYCTELYKFLGTRLYHFVINNVNFVLSLSTATTYDSRS